MRLSASIPLLTCLVCFMTSRNLPADEPLIAAKPASDSAANRGPKIDGEQFRMRQVIDQQQGGIPVSIFLAPERWRDRSQVGWNYEHISNPVSASVAVENPTNEEAFFLHPAALFFCLRPEGGLYRPGQNSGGLRYTSQPLPPATAFAAIVQQLRAGTPSLELVGQQDLPDLPKALQIAGSPKQRGIGVKVTYQLNGKPIEEEFYGVYDLAEIPYDGPQGRTWQINWGLTALHSFRAPAGTLDRRRPVFAAIAKSFRPNPAWQQRLTAINAYLAQEFNRQLQEGYDAITAAGALSRHISAHNDAMIEAIDRQLASSRSTGDTAKTTRTRSAAEKFDDYVRGVDTVSDPYYGTSQHASTEQIHWTDGYGAYRHSNDPTADPNRTEVGNWQRLELAR